jgi:hypothetical protein
MLLFASCVQAVAGTSSITPYVTNGLVVYYNGTLSGNSLVDLSGNNNTGYATGVTTGIDPTTGAGYINFNGDSSKIDISNNALTNISSPVSIEFYGSINNFSKYGTLVSKYNGSSGWYLSCSPNSPYNQTRFSVVKENGNVPNGYNSNVNLTAGQIYHIVATYDNNTSCIYINAVKDPADVRTWNSPAVGNNKNITIGSGYQLAYGNCNMYTFRLYNRSLSQDEVYQNYINCIPPVVPIGDTEIIKRLVYGDGGLPRYMGSYAIQQSDYGLNVLYDNLSTHSSIGTPFFQNNDNSSLTNCSLVESIINGVRWRNCYAPGSSAVLIYTGNNRSVQDTCLLSNDSFNLNHSVTFLNQTQTRQDGVPVNGGGAYEFYGDGLNIINGNNVKLYTDNADVQCNVVYNETGKDVYSYYQTRNNGTRASSLDLPLSSPQLTPMPVPSGYLGALIFTEHADYTDHDSLRTVMYGTNDTKNSTYGKKGFIGHNITATWSVFAVSSYGGEGLDSPELKNITDDMSNHSFEITPHSLSAIVNENTPNRKMVETYLPWYVENYSCRDWIDHGLASGARNSQLKSLGWDPNSPYYIMDLFQNNSILYTWAFIDAKPDDAKGLSTSKNSSVGLPGDIVWQNTNLALPNGTSLYQWKTCATGKGLGLTYYTNSTVDHMLSTYGVSIWHDYWPDNSSALNYYYVRSQPSYTINETFDNFLTNISDQKQAGKLWNPTASQYIDYWIAASNVEVRCTGVNTYTVVNHNSDTVNGFSMRVKGAYTSKLDGTALNTKTNGEDTIFWMNLPTGTHTITLEA